MSLSSSQVVPEPGMLPVLVVFFPLAHCASYGDDPQDFQRKIISYLLVLAGRSTCELIPKAGDLVGLRVGPTAATH
ncbi:MAG: hypothetical protein JWO19_193 [Bryobacterales bacterium]|jgi:hypothetical protein|nr:hypothetical protein [Bryobacterales bacterium]